MSFVAGVKTFLRAHLAEIGRAVLPCVMLFTAAVMVLEFFRPGITASAVAPQVLALVAAVGLGLAIIKPPQETAPRSRLWSWAGLAGYGLLAIAASGFAFWAAAYYFSPIPEARGWLTAAVGLTVTLLLAACATPVPDDL